MQAAAPMLTVVVATVGPPLAEYAVIRGRSRAIKKALAEMKAFRDSCEPGTDSRANADKNVATIEGDVMKMITARAKWWARR
jgi:hypothetical protein